MQGEMFYDQKAITADFKAQLKAGTKCDCPTCGRHAQMYHRKFHASMARQLIELYRLGGTAHYIHASKLIIEGLTGAGDFTKSKYWGLIHSRINTDANTKSNGQWMLSEAGLAFVRGRLRIPAELLVFDDEVIEASADTITIKDALGTRFNYHELMGM